MSGIQGWTRDLEHGTRAKYVRDKCRCEPCRAANAARYRERQNRKSELAAVVTPTGKPSRGWLRRAGKRYRIERCPGANGAKCVATPATWLRVGAVCGACVERVTVWDGLVDADRARTHLKALSAAGVGYKSVAAASGVATSLLGDVLAGSRRIRASSERRILAVDASALADHALIDATQADADVSWILAQGFTQRGVAVLLGYAGDTTSLQTGLGKRGKVTAKRAADISRLRRRVERGDVKPDRPTVEAGPTYKFIRELVARGVSVKWLSETLDYNIQKRTPRRVFRETAERVAALREQIDTMRADGEALPENWQVDPRASSPLAEAFGPPDEGGKPVGWQMEWRTSKAAKKREEKELRRLARTKPKAKVLA